MIYTTGTSGRVEGLRMMTKVETGSHLGMSLVHSRKVSAMILEPVSTGMVLHHRQCSCLVMWSHVMSFYITSSLFTVGAQLLLPSRICINSNSAVRCQQIGFVISDVLYRMNGSVLCAREVFVPVRVWLCASRQSIQACVVSHLLSAWLSACTDVL